MKTHVRIGLILLIFISTLRAGLAVALPAGVVDVSKSAGNQSESFIVINPTNPQNIVAFANEDISNNTFRAYTLNGGATWTSGDINVGTACCDGQSVAFDSFGNLFLVYIDNTVGKVNLIVSTNGGATFSAPTTVGTGSIDQPSIAAGNGSIWVDWNSGGNMVARGAPVTGLGAFGPFGAQQTIPSASGSFGGIAVGPGAAGSGKVMVVYQNPTSGQGPATIFVNVDPDGLGPMGFNPRVTVTNTNVGGFDFIPAQNGRSIDAESGLAWDATGGTFNGRVYLVYTDEVVNENNDTNIMVRTSTDDGSTWSAPVKVNDDSTTRSQFNPYVSMDEKTGTVGVTFHDCRNDIGVPGVGGTNGVANDDAQYFATYSTDGGATWALNTQLTCGFSNSAAAANGIDYGDYVGTDSYCGVIWGAWADNSNCTGDNPGGTLHNFDLYVRPLAFLAVDLGVINTDGGVSVSPGGNITYALSYNNTGRLATGVVLTETVPANTTFNAGASSPGWACTPNNNAGSACTLNLNTLFGCGGSGSANYVVTVDNPLPGGVTQITDTAGIHDDNTNGADGNPLNNTSTETTPVVGAVPVPDLTLLKTDGGASVNAGGIVTYTLTYANAGSADATGVVVTETVPNNSTFTAGSSTGVWSCPDGSAAGTTCTQTIGSVTVGSGATTVFAITALNPFPTGINLIVNSASIADDGTHGADPHPGNNNALDSTPVSAAPDLSITKSDGGITVNPGDPIPYVLNYANIGNQNAGGVKITEIVPADSTFNAGASTGVWTCVPNNNAGSTCTLPLSNVNGGGGSGSATFAVTVDNPVPGGVTQISNTASISDNGLSGPDPNLLNNSASDTTPLNVGPSCLFCDDFEDGILAPPGVWTYTSTVWSENGGTLIGANPRRKTTTIASPIFSGCLTCAVESTMNSAGGASSRISMFAWYIDKKNCVELILDEARDKWILKQRVANHVVKKVKAAAALNAGQFYTAHMVFDGTNIVVTIDGVPTITVAPAGLLPGTVGFRVKRTTGTFGYIDVR